MVIHKLDTAFRLIDISLDEAIVDALGGQLLSFFVGDPLDILAEFDLQIAWQIDAVILQRI